MKDFDINKAYYSCSECQSEMEIIKLDEEFIEFKCNKNHDIRINIKEYLDKIKENKNKELPNDDIILGDSICNKHKEKYLSYCFECNIHLCETCLISGEHSYHYKIFIKEIMPKNEILLKIKNLIKNNKKKIKDLNKNKKDIENKLEVIFNENTNKIKDIKFKNKKMNNNNKKEELKLNKHKYESEIEKLKVEYINKIKDIKMKYNNNINKIMNKYILMNNENENIYNNKINKLKKEINNKFCNYKFNEKINKITNFNELIEIIYNTYINSNNNYYNAININNIYNKYFKFDNNIIKLKETHNVIKNYETKLKEYEIKLNEKDNIIQNNINEINQYKFNNINNNMEIEDLWDKNFYKKEEFYEEMKKLKNLGINIDNVMKILEKSFGDDYKNYFDDIKKEFKRKEEEEEEKIKENCSNSDSESQDEYDDNMSDGDRD